MRTVSIIEVLQNYNKIEDLNEAQFHKLCAAFARDYDEKVCEYVLSNIRYSDETIASLKAILDSHGVDCHGALGGGFI